MSNDGVAIVFNLDPRLQESKHSKPHKMAPREGTLLDSLRASFSSRNPRIDNRLGPRSTSHSKNNKRRREKKKERERDLSFVILPRSASSLILGKSSSIAASAPPPPPLLGDRLPKHSNIFTGIPTPTDSAITSARNSQHFPSKPGTPVHEHPLRLSRSVPDWTSEQRRQYRYFQETSENELPRMPSALEPQPTSNPVVSAEEVEILEGVIRGVEIPQDNSPKLPSMGRYKKKNQKTTISNRDESSHQQRSSTKFQKLLYLDEHDRTQENEALGHFLGRNNLGNGMNGPNTAPFQAHMKSQQQRPNHSPNPQDPLLHPHHQIRRRSTAPAATDDGQRHTSPASQNRLERPTSTSTYQMHRGHPLYPVVEETPPSLPLPEWSGDWSPHLQQGSELFFETGIGMDLGGSISPAPRTPPLVEMGIPSPQAKTRPASWACPIRPTTAAGLDPVKSGMARHSHELRTLFPPTPPSSTGDVWDDSQKNSDTAVRERKFFFDMLRHSWNVFVLVWALLLILKSVQFVVSIIDTVVLEPVKLFISILRNFAEG